VRETWLIQMRNACTRSHANMFLCCTISRARACVLFSSVFLSFFFLSFFFHSLSDTHTPTLSLSRSLVLAHLVLALFLCFLPVLSSGLYWREMTHCVYGLQVLRGRGRERLEHGGMERRHVPRESVKKKQKQNAMKLNKYYESKQTL